MDRGTCTFGDPETIADDETRSDCEARSDFVSFTSYTWVPNPVKGVGQFSIYIPSTVLKEAGFTAAPLPGAPLYIAYSVDYTEATGTNSAETRVIETDINWVQMDTNV